MADLTSEELTALQEKIATEFGTLSDSIGDSPTREAVDAMNELADANDAIVQEQGRRTAEAAELSAAAEEAIARMSAGESADGEATDVAEEVGEETGEEDLAAKSDDPEEEDFPVADDAPAEAPAEGSPEEEKAETPAEEDEEQKKKDLKPFSAESEIVSEAVVDAPAEAEAAVDVAEVSEAAVEVAEVSEAAVEAPVEAEAAVEVPAEAEAAVEEAPVAESAAETPIETVAEFATTDSNTESSEEAVTASNTPEFEAPEELRPSPKAVAPVVITAGADLPGITAGSEFSSVKEVAQALLSRKHVMGRTSGGDGEQHTVATFSTAFPADRMLSANDIEGNRAKINAVVSPEAVVAAGGLTAPVETSYEIFELGETSVRPVRDALAVFGADRGGLRFMTPPVLTDLEGAVSVWTMQDDIDAATPEAPNPVKPCLRVAAGVEVTVYTDAIPLCLTFGNLSSRAYPELVERHTQLAMVQQARFAETRLLTRIGALSTQVTAGSQLGAARDIFVQIEQAAAAYRSRYRLDPSAPLRTIFPEWFKNALRADLTKQLPGDGRDGTFNLGEAEINQWFSTRNINVSWHLDGETGQIFGAQADGALLGFPANVIWYLFSEGTFLFLDGGTLDLGLVRDSTLNGTNDYKVFVETFEGVAKVGVESLRVTSALAIKGASSATVAVAG
jgi:chemotaxis protein histidine kinase CheA